MPRTKLVLWLKHLETKRLWDANRSFRGRRDSLAIVFKYINKSRLVAKGFTQVKGVDFHEVFSPVVKYSSI